MAIGAALLISCGDGGGSAEVTAPTVPAAVALATKAIYNIQLVNGADNTKITDAINVQFVGTPALLDLTGASLNGKTVVTTSSQVGLGAVFTDAAKEFKVTAGNPALGWSEGVARVTGDTTTNDTQTVVIRLTNIKQFAALNANTTTAVAGATQSVTIGATASTTTTPAKTSVNSDGVSISVPPVAMNIPVGVRVLDPVTGAVVTPTGAVTVGARSIATTDSAAIASAFPGGLGATFVAGSAGPSAGVVNPVMVPAAFGDFTITDAAGKALTRFNPDINLSLQVPKTTLKPTGVPYAVGDSISIYSYNTTSAGWVYEKEGTIALTVPDSANYVVTFSTNHLTPFMGGGTVSGCTATVTLTGRGADTRPLRVVLESTNSTPFSATKEDVTGSTVSFTGVNPTSSRITVYDNNSIVGRSNGGANLCIGGGTVAVSLPARDVGTLTVNVSDSCPSGTNQRAYPVLVSLSRTGVVTSVSEYAVAGASSNAATATFSNVASGAVTIGVFNKYLNTTTSTPATVPAGGGTAILNVNLPNVPCGTGTGAT